MIKGQRMTIKGLHPLFFLLSLASLPLMADLQRSPLKTLPPQPVVQPEDTVNRLWTGIGRLRTDNSSYCTASLIDTRDSLNPDVTAPAYIITSHRCLNTKVFGHYEYSGGIQYNVPIKGTIYFNRFENTPGQLKAYPIKRITWQSNEGLNIAIIELDASLTQLVADGIQPLKIAHHVPPTGTEILAFGIPEFSSLHVAHCTQLPITQIATYPWVSTHLLANECKDLGDGGKGGPVIDKASSELISVLVAGTHATEEKNKCLSTTPCELAANTSYWRPDRYYTRPVSFLNQCFTRGRLNTERTECNLHKLASIKVDQTIRPPARILEVLSSEKEVIPDQFELNISMDTPYYRYKYTHDANACHSGHHYSAATPATQLKVLVTLNNRVGMHLLCLVGLDSPDARLTSAQFEAAKIIAIERIAARPAHAPDMKTFSGKNHGERWVVAWKHDPMLMDHYKIKYGPYESVDCAAPQGYEEIPDYEVLHRNSGPWEEVYIHKDHPTNPNLILIKKTQAQLENGVFYKNFTSEHRPIKLCSILYNVKNEPSAPRIDILSPL